MVGREDGCYGSDLRDDLVGFVLLVFSLMDYSFWAV